MKYAEDIILGNRMNVEIRNLVPVAKYFSLGFWNLFCEMDQRKASGKPPLF